MLNSKIEIAVNERQLLAIISGLNSVISPPKDQEIVDALISDLQLELQAYWLRVAIDIAVLKSDFLDEK